MRSGATTATTATTGGVTRRRLLRGLGAGVLGAGTGMGAYGALYEPHHPVLEQVSIPVRNLPPAFEGFRIAFLSDLHVQPGFPAAALEPALRLAQAQQPDLFVLGGDYINDDAPNPDEHMTACAGALACLRAPCGVVAIFGNHDYPPPPADPSSRPFIAAGILPMSDEVRVIRRDGARLYLVGLRSFLQRPVDPATTLAKTPVDSVRIVLWHEPDRASECAAAGASLQLSGHTHGGQVNLPLLGPPFLPAGGRKYVSGLYQVEGMPLYVTRGVGLLSPRIRLNCPPEVTLITLHREK